MQPSEIIVVSVNLTGLSSSSTVLSTAISYQTIVATTVITGPRGEQGPAAVVFSPTPPSRTDVIWVDTDEINTNDVQIALQNYGMGAVVHGSDANTPRPDGFNIITWIGSVAPLNAVISDIWVYKA
jgi:hypothetical protein